jgi:hypothetical protein
MSMGLLLQDHQYPPHQLETCSVVLKSTPLNHPNQLSLATTAFQLLLMVLLLTAHKGNLIFFNFFNKKLI